MGFPPWLPRAGRALACTVLGQEADTEEAYYESLESGAEDAPLAEVAAMAHLFGGFPRAIQGLHRLAAAARRAGRTETLVDVSDDPRAREAHGERGRRLFQSIYAAETDRVLDSLSRPVAGYSRWVLEHAYGRVLGRPALAGRDRELLAIAALIALDCPVQLFSHARGARRLGATPDDLPAMAREVEDLVSPEAWTRADAVLRRARAEPD